LTPVSIHGPQSPGWRPRTRTRSQPVFPRLSPRGPPMPCHARLLRTVDPGYQAGPSRTPQEQAAPRSPPCGGRLLRTSATKPFAFVWTPSPRDPASITRLRIPRNGRCARLLASPPGRRWLRVRWCCQRNPSRPVYCYGDLGRSPRIFRTEMVGEAYAPYSPLWPLDQPGALGGQRLVQPDERLETSRPGGSGLSSCSFERHCISLAANPS
jgi:hypothetical protein